jgi:adenine-specific DNA-methyltransferase
MMQLNNTYNRNDFLQFLEENFLTDFKKDIRPASAQGLSSIQKAYTLGRSERLDLQVFEFSFEGSPNKRVTLTKDAFQVMRSYAIFQALAIFHSPDSDDWRLSFMTATPEKTEKGKVALVYSNPKRLSFFLGPNAKVNTPYKFLLKSGTIRDFEDLKSRFSIEVVNKEFYKEISGLFTKLVGGSVQNGKKMESYKALLNLPDIQDHSQTSLEFAVRLIGRVIFCWFLREKKSDQGKSLMPNDLLSLEAVNKIPDYYHSILEPIFFEVLNKPIASRKDYYDKEPFSSIPYLNGGLFSPQDDDYFSYNENKQAANRSIVIIPDEWLRKLFEVLETYNFTIDENTGFDEELSIDPEMLGRIFENLLAEINPETGESARKSTGSYYTPRVIVDYMIDQCLLLYLKRQTRIEGGKLRSVISYNLNDDEENSLTEEEREQIISALEKIKILDPACGSGAFPIGALQKIVFILQQTDPEGRLWFKKQIKNTSPELRRVVEREFAHKNFDYIRKLGIIRENIYGIDIQPIATEIARLRCFLTLVVDERIQENLENRGIEPLPNLDFKFVTSNSLISLPETNEPGQITQTAMFDNQEKIDELKLVRDQYFTASGIEREQLKAEFSKLQKDLVFQLVQEHGYMSLFKAELTHKLTEWDPFSHKASSWFDPEWMFGITDGFDVVIANPPYIRIQTLIMQAPLEVEYYKKTYRAASKGNYDIYVVFVERGLSLLNKNGCLGFILPHKFFNARYGEPLRALISENKYLSELVHFGDKQVFDQATTYTCLLFLDKSGSKECSVIKVDDLMAWHNTGNSTKGTIPAESVSGSEWNFTVGEGSILFEKLNNMPVKFGDVANIFVGLQTSADTVFLFKDVEKTNSAMIKVYSKELGRHIELEANLLKPVVRSGNIGRYWAEETALVLFPYYTVSGKSQLIPEAQLMRDYPKVWDYLVANKNLLSGREHGKFQATGWYQLYPKNLDLWEQQKILIPYMITRLSAFYDTSNLYFVNVTTGGFGVTVNEQYGAIKYG